ncbi:hypothetical protein B0H17DRAFT_1083230 [Mycena rosella]|uniref:Uncharacterized protein n=1 Tax=Mycena rosella TaxID=1033263 RepID=A0AAD7D171_MYCRO|nr:hypothetical protein B0H17DRAFT_1083230 [Mycena rosella]
MSSRRPPAIALVHANIALSQVVDPHNLPKTVSKERSASKKTIIYAVRFFSHRRLVRDLSIFPSFIFSPSLLLFSSQSCSSFPRRASY